MSEFNAAPFNIRYSSMGDTSEKVFESLYPNFHRLGLNRPNMNVNALPAQMRYLPDYLTTAGMVEVMGIGRDKTLKLKFEKMHALQQWTSIMQVHLFVYDSHRRKWWIGPIEEWQQRCVEHATVAYFSDNNKPYMRLLSDNFPTEGNRYAPTT